MNWPHVAAGLFSELALAFLSASTGAYLIVRAAPAPNLARFEQRAQLIKSIEGKPLWGTLAQDGRWRFSANANEVDPKYLKMLIAYEDRRFWSHPGVDAFALARALFDVLRFGRPVSGASTLTMQTVRLLEPRPRTISAKIDQILKALKLERMMTKPQILKTYLTLVPFGGNIDGARAAALQYFGKEPRFLTWSEAALLVAVPQAPEARRLDRRPGVAQAARDRIARSLAARGVLTAEEERLARLPVSLSRQGAFAVAAPYFALRLHAKAGPDLETLPTLIDRDLQRQIETLVSAGLRNWDDSVNVAAVVLRNADASVAAYVGGAEFGSPSRGGYIDLTQSETLSRIRAEAFYICGGFRPVARASRHGHHRSSHRDRRAIVPTMRTANSWAISPSARPWCDRAIRPRSCC